MQRPLPQVPIQIPKLAKPKSRTPNDGKMLRVLAIVPKLPKLPSEIAKEEEELRRNGPKPQPPKPMRHLGDYREVIVDKMMDHQSAYQAVMSFKPKKFDTNILWTGRENPNAIEAEKLCLFYGMRGTGKSFTMRHLLSTGNYIFDYGLVLTKTKFNRYWQKYFPEDYVQEFDPIILKLLLQFQAKLVEQWESAGRPRHKPIFKVVILDDIVGNDTRWVQEIDDFATRGRHYQMSVFCATQYPRLLSRVTRGNCDLAFVFFQPSAIECEALWDSYFSDMPLKVAEQFIAKYSTVEEGKHQRQILCVNNMPKTHDLQRRISLVEPVDPGEFVVGSPDFWKKDPRYQDLLQKGAFDRWITYRRYLMESVEGNEGPIGESAS